MQKLQNFIILFLLVLFSAFVLSISIRGLAGNPTENELTTNQWRENGPFELSPERGRFALTYSLVEENSFQFSDTIGKFALPDVATNNGRYVSLFAPLVSVIAVPGYILGKSLGFAQVGSFAIIALFGLLNLLLVRKTAMKLGADSLPATIGGFVFLFATPAFAYAVNLYQHQISTFLILLSFYLLTRSNRAWVLASVFFLCAISIPLDYPNLFFMLPIGLYAFAQIFKKEQIQKRINIKINFYKLLTVLIVIIPIGIFMFLNQQSYGRPLQLAGTLPTAEVKVNTKDINTVSQTATLKKQKEAEKKSALGFFSTRDLLNGIYIHSFSPDRGIIFFTPVMLFGLLGMLMAYKRKVKLYALMVAVIGMNILLYSLWGDPWGGWAFGSRYLIPSYAILSIFISLLLTYWQAKKIYLTIFLTFAIYSTAVNSLGALTSSAIPPKIQVLALEKISGHQEKYSFDRNIDFIRNGNSKSFVYQTYLSEYISALNFYLIISLAISSVIGFMTFAYMFKNLKKGRINV